MRSRVGPLPHFLAAALLLMGCAHADGAADRQMADLRDSLGKLAAERDRTNDRALLDDSDTKPPPAPAAPRKAGSLRTVQIGDDEGRESDDPNDPSARPEIRLQGGGGGGSRPARSSRTRGREEDVRTDTPRSSSIDPEAKKVYEAALAQVNGKQYDRALESLSAFLVRFPDHPYAENATYWRGECYYARGEYLRAAEQFEAVVARGAGMKAPDALLKIGACHERLGASDRAKEYWDRLRREFPRSDAARKIPGSDTKMAGPKENR